MRPYLFHHCRLCFPKCHWYAFIFIFCSNCVLLIRFVIGWLFDFAAVGWSFSSLPFRFLFLNVVQLFHLFFFVFWVSRCFSLFLLSSLLSLFVLCSFCFSMRFFFFIRLCVNDNGISVFEDDLYGSVGLARRWMGDFWDALGLFFWASSSSYSLSSICLCLIYFFNGYFPFCGFLLCIFHLHFLSLVLWVFVRMTFFVHGWWKKDFFFFLLMERRFWVLYFCCLWGRLLWLGFFPISFVLFFFCLLFLCALHVLHFVPLVLWVFVFMTFFVRTW